jgi:hypothetical protein
MTDENGSHGTYTVTDAEVVKEEVGKYGLNVVKATFTKGGKSASAEWMQKPETALPTDGSTLTGTITSSDYGLKFRKDKPAAYGGGGGGSYGKSPEERESIVRQVSAKCATDLAVAMIQKDMVQSEVDAMRVLAEQTEAIFAVIIKAATADKPAGDTSDATPAKADGDDIPF